MTLVQRFIVEAVCYYFGITYEDLLNLDRSSTVRSARMVVIRLLYNSDTGYKEIGVILKRHHTSIMSNNLEIDNHDKLLTIVELFREQLADKERYFIEQAIKYTEDNQNVKI